MSLTADDDEDDTPHVSDFSFAIFQFLLLPALVLHADAQESLQAAVKSERCKNSVHKIISNISYTGN